MLPFIHIPRTGGTSTIFALKHALNYVTILPDDLHWSVEKRLNKNLWTPDKSFTIIRNPWDRLVSWFFWHHYLDIDFDAWICTGMKVGYGYDWFNEPLTNPLDQDKFFTINGEVAVNFVGRFENLKNDSEIIGKMYGVELNLDRLNTSCHTPYREYYRSETRDIVGRRFDAFIKQWNYEF